MNPPEKRKNSITKYTITEHNVYGEVKEKELLKVVVHVEKYEFMIKQVYQYLRTIIYLPEIEWLTELPLNYSH